MRAPHLDGLELDARGEPRDELADLRLVGAVLLALLVFAADLIFDLPPIPPQVTAP